MHLFIIKILRHTIELKECAGIPVYPLPTFNNWHFATLCVGVQICIFSCRNIQFTDIVTFYPKLLGMQLLKRMLFSESHFRTFINYVTHNI